MKTTMIAICLAASALFGQTTATFAADGIVKTLADGKAWNAQPDGGPKMKMTFNPDGTGQMKFGIMTRKVNWTPNGDGLCMTGMPGGKRCITFMAIPKGYQGKSNDGKSMTLTRG